MTDPAARTGPVLAVRPDGMGDVLVTGPAVRALAAAGRGVCLLAGPAGADAACLLPGVTGVLVWRVPWIDPEPPPVSPGELRRVTQSLRQRGITEAVIFTSFHQSPLPTALVLRLAGVSRISAISEDYPGSLLEVRHSGDRDVPEPERALSLARAAGFALPAGDTGRLAVRGPLPDVTALTGGPGYVAVHPGAAAPARAPSPDRSAAMVRALAEAGHRVVVTGTRSERAVTGWVAGGVAADLGGRTTLPMLAAVLAGARVVVAPNTGAAHLAAAVGTPVVSLFAPVVSAARWLPYGVPTIRLGDQHAACAGSRARSCPVPGHPCLDRISTGEVVRAVADLAGVRGAAPTAPGAPGWKAQGPGPGRVTAEVAG